MPNIVNTLVTKQLEDELSNAEGMLLVSFGGLTVAESEDLRAKLGEHDIGFRMVRNKLARRVLAAQGHDFDATVLSGNTGIAFGDAEAAILAAKVFTDKEVKKAGKVKVQAGMLSGEVLGQKDAELLADVPDKDTLRAKILGCLSGSARGIAASIDANLSGLARLLQARADQLESQPDSQ